MSSSISRSSTYDEVQEIYGNFSKNSLNLLYSLTDPEPCRFDHNHSCQEHGYFYLEQGELCPVYESQLILTKAKNAGIIDWELPYSLVVFGD